MSEITPETFPTLHKVNPLDGLPEWLKDPKHYIPVQKALLETMRCPKSHGEIVDIFKCKTCTENMLIRKALMTKFGFTSPNQYMAWKKNHEEIKRRVPLDKYNYMLKHD